MKTTHVFISAALLLSLAGSSQNADSSRIKIGVTASADYCSYLLYLYDVRQDPGEMFLREQPGIGWTAGAMGSYSLNSNWSLTGGVRFSEHNIINGPHDMYDINRNKVGTFKLTYHNRYIDAPIGIQFNTDQSKRISFIANTALTPGYALGEWNKLDFEGNDTLGISDNVTKSTIENFNYFSLKAEFYAGIGINFNRFQVQFLPQVRFNLFKATSDSNFNRQYWTSGLEFRVLYTL